jgi:GNAT superfamily N-acetyltransferase
MELKIRPFTLADVPFGMLLTDAEEWHRTPPDWVRLQRLEPEGVFKAVADGIPAGTAAAVTFASVAWIHSVIVQKDFRRRGIGEALMRACLDFVDRRGIPCTKLDSVPGTEPFYARLGFVEEYPSWRLLADGAPGTPRATRVRTRDYPAVLAFDRMMTGLDRSQALEAILADYPDRAFLVRARGKVRGYIIVRRGEWRDPIGPWVADPEDPGLAADLLRAALSASRGKTFRMCVGGYHDAALRIAEELGFTRAAHSTRMYRGAPFEESRACYGMISAEKG